MSTSTEGKSPARRGIGLSRFVTSWWRDLFLALTFFTRLPVGSLAPAPEATAGTESATPQARLAEAARAFPLAGLVVGLAGGLVYWIAVKLGLSGLLAAFLAVAATAALTGALHEDGWADFADGLGCRGDRIRKLAAMKDSHIGSFGVLALIFATGVKTVALAQLYTPDRVVTALVAAHVLSRAVLPLAMRSLPLATSQGLAVMAGRPSAQGVYVALGIGFVIAFCAVFLPAAIVALIVAVVAAALVGAIAKRQFGGYTGDVLGAIEQVAEIAVLINLVSLLP
ncbi:adenosylcobinamide-GDP ribazoletransferase [Dongia sedimenti]|uniref:Adenosylcobinamide-GDP ribazoletransferase n=1 Tax=Dongia sedimenti TaxID=3064282 RepID=A0ABU0YUY8_9PROT|nr:adenosylcobinamide-GDP ribazoletransferase [Rhodospirillaceae bacterium R-7]